MKRWIVNAAEKAVREQQVHHANLRWEEPLKPDEFFWDGTYADAMAAGARRRLAEEALTTTQLPILFTVVNDRIEPAGGKFASVAESRQALAEDLKERGFDVWREGTGLLILGRLPS